jgi:hypothetical protein
LRAKALIFDAAGDLQYLVGMNSEFERLVERAADPNLIPGIYNYCDARCPRCPFTERCLSFLENRDLEARQGPDTNDETLAEALERSIQRTIEFLKAVAARDGFDLSAALAADPKADEDEWDPARHWRDPLVVRAREYANMTYPVMQALRPVLVLRADAALTDAAETIAWFSTLLAPKIGRAIASRADRSDDPNDRQSDANGSAKVARLAIAESRRAWEVLMEAGKASADGVPAAAVKMLDEIDRQLAERFPLAMEFVRPGFDEPAVAAGAQTRLPPFAPR